MTDTKLIYVNLLPTPRRFKHSHLHADRCINCQNMSVTAERKSDDLRDSGPGKLNSAPVNYPLMSHGWMILKESANQAAMYQVEALELPWILFSSLEMESIFEYGYRSVCQATYSQRLCGRQVADSELKINSLLDWPDGKPCSLLHHVKRCVLSSKNDMSHLPHFSTNERS